MVADRQVVRLMNCLREGRKLAEAADRAGMSEKTARKYRDLGRLPSEVAAEHVWRTRADPFEEVWDRVKPYLEKFSGLQAKTLFEWLQGQFPGRFADGQLRTFQRRVKTWRATEGPPREVMFPQRHYPGRLAESDFTHMNSLGVTIQGQLFEHMIYHFVLTFSNWETGTVCFAESFESLSRGLQSALWRLGGVPEVHQTDSLTAAVRRIGDGEMFTARYQALLDHYGARGQHTQPRKPHENGDIEQSNRRFKESVDQRLMLRGSRDFESRESYEGFLDGMFEELNAGRQKRFKEETACLRELPRRRLEHYQRVRTKVGPYSTIRLKHNLYSVHSRLIGEQVEARLYAEHIDVYLGQRRVHVLPRLRGEKRKDINYRHVIDWLVRKPGAFERYLYRDALFPTSRFRMAFDQLERTTPAKANKEYLRILHTAAHESESLVDECLRWMIDEDIVIAAQAVEDLVVSEPDLPPPRQVHIEEPDLEAYDELLSDAWLADAPIPAAREAPACL